MLASRRQPLHLALGHLSQQPSDYNFDYSSPPRRSSSSSSFSNYLPSPSNFDTDNLQQNYISPSPIYPAPALSIAQGAFADDYMTSGFDFSSPAIRVQQSTPTPQQSFGYPQQSVLADGGAQITNNWLYGEGNGQMMPGSSLQTPAVIRRNISHQRGPSSSSTGSSNSPASPFSQGHAPHLMYGNAVQSPSTAKLQSSYNADEASRNYSNHHLPTPTQTPTQDSFVASSQVSFNNSYPSLDTATAAHMAMRHALADANSVTGDDAPDFSHSTRHSVSSFGRNSPATPRTINGEDFDEGFKVPSNDTYRTNAQVPKLERTMTDVFSDELYNPTSQPTSAQKAKNHSLLSPYHNMMMNERLNQANQARSQSPTTSSTRALSPFRQGSPYAQTNSGFQSPAGRFGPQQIQEQRLKAEAHANALSRPNAADSPNEPKTISPKDAMLEYHESEEDAKMPLFPDGDTASYSTFSSGNFQNSIPATAADNSYGGLAVGNAWTNSVGQSSASYGSATSAAAPRQNHFSFTPASVPGAPHGLPSNTFSSSGNMPANTEETPEFEYPAHLTSMESSISEAPPQSSQNSNHTDIAAKPSSTLADTGTYTCTYHGCTQRFETPQKLQRHKREAHRQSTQQQPQSAQASAGVGSAMTSSELLLRNSQSGPHKCSRINPSTQKPCNTIFSRPYDLTRHEDTIHNARKQKVRCALCTNEEKTFSRNDALTRHMRVVHPDVDFPGKHRRRGGRDD